MTIEVAGEARLKLCAFDYCFDKTKQHLQTAAMALTQFPDSAYRHALEQLLDFVIAREF